MRYRASSRSSARGGLGILAQLDVDHDAEVVARPNAVDRLVECRRRGGDPAGGRIGATGGRPLGGRKASLTRRHVGRCSGVEDDRVVEACAGRLHAKIDLDIAGGAAPCGLERGPAR